MSTKLGSGHIPISPVFPGFRKKTVDEVNSTATAATATAKTGFTKAGTGAGSGFASGFKSAAASVAGTVKSIGSSIASLATPIAGVVTAAGGITAALGFQRLVGIDTARSKLSALGHDATSVQNVMDSALASVKGTAFGLGDAAGAAASAVAAGVKPGEQLTTYLKSVGDAAAVAGVGFSDMGSIFGKVQTSQKAYTDDLNQLADRGIPIYQYLAEEAGTTAEEVKKMASEGAISSEMFLNAINKNIGGAAGIMGQTSFIGAWQNVLAAVGRVGAAFLDAGGEGGGFFSQLKPLMGDFTSILDTLTPKAAELGVIFGKFTADTLTELRGGITAFSASWTAFDGDVTSSGFPGFMERLAFVSRTVFEELRGGITAFRAAWVANDGDVTSSGFPGFMERVAFVVRQVVDATAGLDFSSFSGFTSSLGSFGPAFGSIGTSVQELMPAVSSFTAQLPELGGGLVTLASGGISILASGLSFLADNAETIVAWMPAIVAGFVAWRVASQAVTAAQVAQAPVLLASNTLGLSRAIIDWQLARSRTAVTAATVANTGATATNTAAQTGGFLATARNTAALVAQRVATVASAVATRAAAAAQWLMNAAMTANPIGLIIAAVVALVAAIVWFFTQTELGQAIWTEFSRFLGEAWANIVAVATTVFTALGEFFTGIWNGIVAVAQFVWQAIVFAVTTYINIVMTIITTVLGAIVTAWNFVWNGLVAAFQFVWGLIVFAVTTYIAIVQAIISTVLTVITTVWNTVWGGISSFFVGIWTFLVAAVTAYVTMVQTIITNVVNAISSVWNAVWGGIKLFFIKLWTDMVQGVTMFVREIEVNIGRAVNFLQALPDQIMGFFAGIGDWLVDSGKALIQGLLDGVEAMFPGITESIGGVMDFIGGFFPQSPAKRGRFSGRGYTSYSGNALIEDYAGGMEQRLPALSRVAAQAQEVASFSAVVATTVREPVGARQGDRIVNFNNEIHQYPGETTDEFLRRQRERENFEMGSVL
ncbi:tape measure protein [Pseudoclavibacter sp. RFBB5]|uniref:tape measure protein n=1 Tax=Pseudoclavibacter sp. RFBB5 TaxID=2080574 RepID=UPI000CE79079|nr:tape measure protein [Pseudoclavibacter sp. RFBB5]PPG29643.1 hypothetical protein C5B97_11770 [Pseudoclavibacter sp. RFBB5]